MFYQGEIDAHEDSFKSTDEAGQALLNTGHYASEEVKEKVCLTVDLFFCRLFLNHHSCIFNSKVRIWMTLILCLMV